jgi:hypothetical protein
MAAAVAALLLGGCTTNGMGGGELFAKGPPQEPVLFSWQSKDGGLSGDMVATLSNATYQGPFFQITNQTDRLTLLPLWLGWAQGWPDWPYWGYGAFGPYDVTQFIARYTGKVVANLQTPAGRMMRCRLHLVNPSRGMAGGGECQVEGGGTIHAKF